MTDPSLDEFSMADLVAANVPTNLASAILAAQGEPYAVQEERMQCKLRLAAEQAHSATCIRGLEAALAALTSRPRDGPEDVYSSGPPPSPSTGTYGRPRGRLSSRRWYLSRPLCKLSPRLSACVSPPLTKESSMLRSSKGPPRSSKSPRLSSVLKKSPPLRTLPPSRNYALLNFRSILSVCQYIPFS